MELELTGQKSNVEDLKLTLKQQRAERIVAQHENKSLLRYPIPYLPPNANPEAKPNPNTVTDRPLLLLNLQRQNLIYANTALFGWVNRLQIKTKFGTGITGPG